MKVKEFKKNLLNDLPQLLIDDEISPALEYRLRKELESLDDLRYDAVGSSVPVQILKWIGQRIEAVENL